MTWFYSILSVLIVSLISFIGLFTISVRFDLLKKIIFIIVSLSVGALFGDAFIHLIPESLERGLSYNLLSLSVISGLMIFFILEKFLLWQHSHGKHEDCPDCEPLPHKEDKHLGTMVLIGDGIHNFLDGAIIGLSFLVNFEVGLATTLAVILHEIPQEIGDFGLLIHSGYSRFKALFFNFLSALTSVLGVIFVLTIGLKSEKIIPIGLAIAAGGFIYIAGSDLVPELHKTKDLKKSLIQVLSILLGLGLMFGLLAFE